MRTVQDHARDCVRRAVVEDLDRDDLCLDADLTSRLAVPASSRGRAEVRAKAAGVLAGLDCAGWAFELLDPECNFEPLRAAGDWRAPSESLRGGGGSPRR